MYVQSLTNMWNKKFTMWHGANNLVCQDRIVCRKSQFARLALVRRAAFLGLRYWDSDYKRTLPPWRAPSLHRDGNATPYYKPTFSRGDAMLHRASNWQNTHIANLNRRSRLWSKEIDGQYFFGSPEKALFGPAGIDQREMQAGCQNGEQRWSCLRSRLRGSYSNPESYLWVRFHVQWWRRFIGKES